MPVSVQSLNSGDVFLLDYNNIIYQWMGKSCNRMEKGKALDLTTRMRGIYCYCYGADLFRRKNEPC